MTHEVCAEGVTRRGEFQPCDKPAVAFRYDERDSGAPYPVCVYHTRAPMVQLLTIEAQQALVADALRREAYCGATHGGAVNQVAIRLLSSIIPERRKVDSV